MYSKSATVPIACIGKNEYSLTIFIECRFLHSTSDARKLGWKEASNCGYTIPILLNMVKERGRFEFLERYIVCHNTPTITYLYIYIYLENYRFKIHLRH